MCGIAGYIGERTAADVILKILGVLEYRGYDSAGIATVDESGELGIRKEPGELSNLIHKLDAEPLSGGLAIGHTRWATHGPANEVNAHPHADGAYSVAVVHNGIIENDIELKRELQSEGCVFKSETDTEVVPQLISNHLKRGMSPLQATRAALGRLKGAFALAIVFGGHNDLMIVARQGSPLVIGFNEAEAFVGSDGAALTSLADRILYLEDGDIGVVTRDGSTVYDALGNSVERKTNPINTADLVTGKAGYDHFMQKEICEQPTVVGKTLRAYSDPDRRISKMRLPFSFKKLDGLTVIACGTAKFAGDVARYWFRKYAGLDVECGVASEYVYDDLPKKSRNGFIVISQSGETKDTLSALNRAKSEGYPTLAIVNAPNSAIERAADATLHTIAGPEIGVASTKAFTTQLAVLAALAVQAGRERGTIDADLELELTRALEMLPAHIQSVLGLSETIQEIAQSIATASNMYYLGRGVHSVIAAEGALKIKEISYIHAESCPSGELKHGPIALIDHELPSVFIAPKSGNETLFGKTASNLREVVSRKGKAILLSDKEGCAELEAFAWRSVALPTVHPFVSPFACAVAVQLLAYHTAVCKGTNVDKPRNLAKSVTVE